MVFVIVYSAALPYLFLFSARVTPVVLSASRSGWARMPEGFDAVAVRVVLISLRVRIF